MKMSWPALTALSNLVVAISVVFGLILGYVSLQPPDAPKIESATYNPVSDQFVVEWNPVDHPGGIREYIMLRRLESSTQAMYEEIGRPRGTIYRDDCEDYNVCIYRLVAVTKSGLKSERSDLKRCNKSKSYCL